MVANETHLFYLWKFTLQSLSVCVCVEYSIILNEPSVFEE